MSAKLKGVDGETLQKNLIVLNGQNYKEWAHKFTGLFGFLSLSNHIELDLNCFDDPRWVESEQDIKRLLVSFSDNQYHDLIEQSKTVALAWDKLKAICETSKTPYELFVSLDSFKFTDSTDLSEIKNSFQQCEFLCDNLSMLKYRIGGEFHKKIKLVSSLPDTFRSIKEQLINDLKNLDYETIKTRTLEYAKELTKEQINVADSLKKSSSSVRKPANESQITDQRSAVKTAEAIVEQIILSKNETKIGQNILIVDAKGAQNYRMITSGNANVPAIQDIRYMSPEELEKSLKREISSTTPPSRKKSESVERKSRRQESPHCRRHNERRNSKSNRDLSRNRRDNRLPRIDSTQRNAFFSSLPNVSINQNKVNKDFPFPKETCMNSFKNLQTLNSMSECNRVLLSHCFKS